MGELLLKSIGSTQGLFNLKDGLKEKKVHIGVTDIEDSLKLLYTLSLKENKNMLFICENELTGEKISTSLNEIQEDIAIFINPEPIHYYFVDSHSRELTHERIKAINEILHSNGKIVVTPIDTLFKKLLPPEEFKKFYLNLEVGKIIEMEYLINRLVHSGYERTALVESKGQFSVRGGIIDVFNIGDKNPIRIEFFDDEIDSIRPFELESQISIGKREAVEILPAKEILFSQQQKKEAICLLEKSLKNKKEDYIDIINDYKNDQINKLEGLISYYKGKLTSLLHYFDNKGIFVLNETSKFNDKYYGFTEQLKEDVESLLEKKETLPSFFDRFYTLEDIKDLLEERKTIDYQSLHKNFSFIRPSKIVEAGSKESFSFYGKIPEFVEQLIQWKKDAYTVVLVGNSSDIKENIREMLEEYNIIGYISDGELLKNKVNIVSGHIEKGFILYKEKYAFIAEKDIFKTKAKPKKHKLKKHKGRKIESFTDLNIGDYIVHDIHGIGVYMGIEQITVEGIKKDYLQLQYAKGDKLYIPVDQMEAVQVYIGIGDKKPKVNKLGSNDWKKSKQSTKSSVKDMAKELLEIYAKRKQSKGYAFSKDSNWTREFEEKFPHEETDDQLQAIAEVKEDMESTIPMDRLICGDVGYGKTEVAIRAAFKAIMDNKQVALLVPTTILAQQHYNSFLSRFEDYPIKIEMLSRFRSKKQQNLIVEEIKKNRVDIVIGTHRVLSKDIKFYDLGLLIVDEEQRFGVKHKEKIKELKANIDVLTLSATPIPRTLHMSLIGARDMSVLNEPPHNRTPVQTYVMEYNDILIRDAIMRELSREGQIYYVYNKVFDIETIVAKISRMVPEARIAIAHGKMTEIRLENIMIDFMNHEYDILICTTIIESGLDISNANTIVIEDADRMGLSQLYQLRGRVGRSNRLSYAYITYGKDKTLKEVAEKRLKAIKDFTDFGSGFKIAMRDLEIRGAGNILGSKQHGHLTTVGYDMYCKLLDHAVKELKGEEIKTEINTLVELDVDAYIPSHYVESEKQKYQLYKKIIGIESQEEMYDIEEEIEDRYGDLPKTVQNLLLISYIKTKANKLSANKIKAMEKQIQFTFEKDFFLTIEEIKDLIKEFNIKLTELNEGETGILLPINAQDQKLLLEIKEFIERLENIKN